MQNQQQPPRHFSLHKSVFKRQYELIDQDTNLPAYMVQVSKFTPNKPDLILTRGADKSAGPIVACSHFKKLSRDVKLGLGDYLNDPGRVSWVDFTSDSRLKVCYSFEWALPDGTARTFSWKKSSHHAADGEEGRFFSRNYKLVDDTAGNGTVVAVFTTKRGIGEDGILQINVDHGAGFQELAVITLVSLYEKLRRRAAAASSSGAAGA